MHGFIEYILFYKSTETFKNQKKSKFVSKNNLLQRLNRCISASVCDGSDKWGLGVLFLNAYIHGKWKKPIDVVWHLCLLILHLKLQAFFIVWTYERLELLSTKEEPGVWEVQVLEPLSKRGWNFRLVKDCGFAEEDNMSRDMIVFQVFDKKVHERRNSDLKLQLQDSMDMCLAAESSQNQ